MSATKRFEFYLAQQTYPWLVLEDSLDEKRSHFDALEAAWRAGNGHRAAS
jgi:hypothetical protein